MSSLWLRVDTLTRDQLWDLLDSAHLETSRGGEYRADSVGSDPDKLRAALERLAVPTLPEERHLLRCDGCGNVRLGLRIGPTLDGSPDYKLCTVCLHDAARWEKAERQR